MLTPKDFHPEDRVTLIVKDADDPRYNEWRGKGYDIIGQLTQHRTPQGLAAGGLAKSFHDYEGTRCGPCIVMGMGASRKNLTQNVRIPVYAVNRAALEYKPDIWCAHDIDSVLDCHERVPLDVPLATYANNWLKPGFDKVQSSGRKLIAWDVFPDPTRHGRRPLYWNVTTVGPVLDWAVRMGHSQIFTIGIDGGSGGYANPHYSTTELAVSHEYVRLKMCFMFTADELPKWNPKGVPVFHLEDKEPRVPWQKADQNWYDLYCE
jgi:hypothetical protein